MRKRSNTTKQANAAPRIDITMRDLLDCEPLSALLPLYQPINKLGQRSGHYLSRVKGRGMVFSEVRAYQAGDDVRAIDWRVTARTGKAHTKLYQEERERPLFILLDMAPSMLFGSQYVLKSTQAAYLAATLCWSGIKAQDRVGFIASGLPEIIESKPTARKRGLLRTLEKICHAHAQHLELATQPASRQSLAESLQRLGYHAHTGSQILIISDFFNMDNDAFHQLQTLGKRNQVMLYPISDPLESNLPSTLSGQLNVTDGMHTQVLNIGNATQKNPFSTALKRYHQQLEQQFVSLGYPLFAISAGEPLEPQLGGRG